MTAPGIPITGREEVIGTARPEGALVEFYKVFNGRDLLLMRQNWDATDEASMDNPLGGIRRGWAEISPTYQRLFEGTAPLPAFLTFHNRCLW
jgi:hypothetical protein